jgi:outer membrane protein OmpA-like peptidoglycan-associated protein
MEGDGGTTLASPCANPLVEDRLMTCRYPVTSKQDLSRPRARAPTAFVAGIAALVGFGPAAAAGATLAEPDADCDGIVNARDDCPTEIEDRDGHGDEDGCPDPDNDGDSIADAADSCPEEREVVNDFEDGDGCPDAAIEIKKDRIELKQRIQFAFDTAAILERSYPILDEIAHVVRDNPKAGVISIEGHADDRGSRSYNQRLSEQRANAVQSHLIGLGIKPARLVHVGRGESQHRATGTSEDARAENRRVEFMVQFALVETPRNSSTRDSARARASLRSPPTLRLTSLITGCVPMSLAASEAALDGPLPVEEVSAAEPVVARSTLLPFGIGLGVGGGVTAFADDQMREFADVAGSWEARLTLGTRQRLAVEAAYLGSVQSIDSLGLDEDAMLLSNGFGGALRLNLATDRVQPYVLAGAAWRRYEVVNSNFNTSSMNDEDDVLETPFGVGLSYRYEHLILDARGVYRRAFYNDLIDTTAAGQEGFALHTWTANLMAGFEF